MKICITSSGENLDSPVNPRFGRCPYFLVVDTETKDVQAVENTGAGAARGAGIAATQTVSDLGCKVIITGNVGPNAFYALNAAGIKAFTGAFGKSCEEALKDYNEGKLTEASATTARGFGFGRGGGFGRGRGGGRGGRV